MSHVISSQPSSTSPYQPTEIQDPANGNNQRKSTMETRQDRDDCCFRADKSQGCFIYYCCNFFSSVCGAIRDCTESCCNCCANCLADCCEDKPEDRKKRRRYRSSISQDYNDYDDNTWVVGAIQHQNSVTEDQPYTITHDTNEFHSSNYDSVPRGVLYCHEISSGHHSSSHNSNGHDSAHHSSGNDYGGHHSSSHDTGTCDSGGDYGGGDDYGGGGDSGGCDSGGGGDCGGGGCDD